MTLTESAKLNARAAVQDAVRKGTLVRPNQCGVCGKAGNVKAHHSNYEEKLKVAWVCSRCHAALHDLNGRHNGRKRPLNATHPELLRLVAAGYKAGQIARLWGISTARVYELIKRARESADRQPHGN